MTKMVIIGGDAAGMSAAAKASRGAEPVDVVVFERGDHTSYAACGLPYLVGGLVPAATDLVARTPEEHRANGIDVRMRHEVQAIDLDTRAVQVRDLDTGTTVTEGFDHLVVATGATPLRPPLSGVDAAGVHGVHVIPDAVAIRKTLAERNPRRVVVVGSGYVGIEMAEAFGRHGLEVTLVELRDHPMATLDPDMGERVGDAMRADGVDLRLGVGLEAIEPGPDGWVRSVATSAGSIETDLVVLGLGFRPNVDLARDAGIVIGPTGAIQADDTMATSAEGVWTAGDCAQSHHRVTDEPVWIALGSHANKQGRVVGSNVSGTPERFPGVIGTAITKVGDCEIGRTGLGHLEAEDAGFSVVSAVAKGRTRAGYYPGAERLAVKVIAERGSGRMLGAQIVGGAESAKRIDPLAVAVWNEMSVADFSQLDLGYAPPFAPVWETSLIAARLAAEQV